MKASKKSLLASGVSLLASAAMLAGATFAWFTDNVVNTGNKIQAGNLAIELWESESDRHSDALAGSPAVTVEGYTTYKNISDAEGGIFADALWEPGYTAVKNLAVYNAGSLAVRYQLLLKDVMTTKGIENVLDLYVNRERVGTLAELANSAVSSGVLLAGSADRVNVQVHMQEQAGNAYQEAYASFAIEVFATQYTYETDGFGSDLYDEAAPLPAVHTQYDFDDPAQAVRFCPQCQISGSTAGHADHTQFAAAFEILDGKAVIHNNTPHIAFNGLDWENSRYTLAYEVDASALSDGARVRFDAGEKTGWQHMFVEVSRSGEACSVQTSRNTAMIPLGEIADTMQVICTFEKNGSGLAMTVAVTDGTHTYSCSLDSATIGDLYWNVYEVGGTSEIYAALDNFKFYATPLRSSVTTSLLATPENAQALLDTAEAGTTVVLAAGNYGVLNLSQTANSTAIDGNTSRLYRTIDQLTIVGEEGAVVDGIRISAGHIYGTPGKPVTNPVTGETTESTVKSYYSTVDVKNLTIRGLTLTDRVYIGADSAPYCTVDGLTLENCTFQGSSTTDTSVKFLHIGNTQNAIQNIVVRGCTVRNAFQGVYVQAVQNVTVEDCTFDGLGHNAIAIQDGSLNGTVCESSGTVLIRDNVIENGSDRAFRFGHFGGSSITITGNRLNNVGDNDGQNCKAESVGNATINLDGNYWAGKTPAQAIHTSMGVIDSEPLDSFS